MPGTEKELQQQHLEYRSGGCGFLLAPAGSERTQTPEAISAEQRAFFRAAERFALERVNANAERIERKDYGFLRQLLREAGDLGLLAIDVPEAYGGLALDLTSSALVTDAMAKNGSWSVTFGVQVGVGTLPIVYFGTEEQKRRYLPGLARGDLVAAYALSEASSGSDALGARTRATLSPDGKHWILNGAKQWITNASFADLFIVFAKIDGEEFSAFLVERGAPGFTIGPEEHKMGIRGSSTCALAFEDARIPVEALLGERGRGHRIAFDILDVGRLKLGVGCVGGCRGAIQLAVQYAKERQAFGRPIAEFGLVREKLARMVALVYAGEAMSFRTAGLVDARAARSTAARGTPEHDRDFIAAVEEYAVEASIVKVFGSEALWQIGDEALQIHGGYGFVEEFPIERVYRDSRVNRIFEGTNEINRLLVTGTLLRRAMKGRFPLLELARSAEEAHAHGEPPLAGPLGREKRMADAAKHMFAHALKAAVEAFGPSLADRQEVLGALADVAIEAYALDSAVARALQSARGGRLDPLAVDCVRLFALESHERAYAQAKRALRATPGDATVWRERLAAVRTLLDEDPADPTALREAIVARTLEAGRYPLRWG